MSVGLRVAPAGLRFLDSTHVRVRKRRLLYFGGTGYLGLAFHAEVRAAFAEAALNGFLQSAASRTTTGEQPAYLRVERQLARFFRVDDAVLVSAGYLAPIAVAHGLRDVVTEVWVADTAHACVQDAATLVGRPVMRFAHGDVTSLGAALKQLPPEARPLVASDGTRGTRGGVAPIDGYLQVLPARGILLVDDAHGAGAVGPGGRGACALLKVRDPRVIQTVSLAKAFGVVGGAILGDQRRLAAIRARAAAFIGTTAPLLPAMAALAVATRLIGKSDLVERLQENARVLHERLPRRKDVLSDPRTPVVGVYPSSPQRARQLREALLRADIFPSFIRYLNGPPNGFLRLAVQAGHSPEDVKLLAGVLAGFFAGARVTGPGAEIKRRTPG